MPLHRSATDYAWFDFKPSILCELKRHKCRAPSEFPQEPAFTDPLPAFGIALSCGSGNFCAMNTTALLETHCPFILARRGVTILLALAIAPLLAPSIHADTAGDEMAAAASNFLAALTPEQRATATYELKNEERLNWHFIPKNDRKGIQFKDLTPEQRNLAHALLASGLSQRGYGQAVTIMSLEAILNELEKSRGKPGATRDPERYYLTIFGQPGAKSVWGWRVEGHHLSVNFTLANGAAAATPSFMGTNPADVKDGPRKGLRVLALEEDLGRQLVKSLNADQRQAAIIADKAPKDIITAAERKVTPLEAAGLSAARMTKDQAAVLRRLIEQYVRRDRAEIADQDLARIQQAGFDKILFAWAGGLERGQGHYYRVQGPTFLLEYDNTQNDNNHVHAAWRDFANDFGEDLLRKHYEQSHGK